MAGNPPGWDSERILASKTLAALGLASVVGGVLLRVGPHLQALLWGSGASASSASSSPTCC